MDIVGVMCQYEHEPMGIINKMAAGGITLDQVAERTSILIVACTCCDRTAEYGLAALIGVS
jgi:hypothetical protein